MTFLPKHGKEQNSALCWFLGTKQLTCGLFETKDSQSRTLQPICVERNGQNLQPLGDAEEAGKSIRQLSQGAAEPRPGEAPAGGRGDKPIKGSS